MADVGKSRVADQYDRPLRDLRISVTDRCNFRCSYCMPEEIFGPDYPFLKREDLLSFSEIERLTRVFVSLGVRKIRITGGEPLLRKNLPELILRIRRIDGIEDLAMTTNGSLLPRYASELKEAGLQRVTVSLDSLDDERFGVLNGKGYKVETVLKGIAAAEAAGMPVKINMVVKKGVNQEDILPMARYFKEKGHILRFIEYMDVGNSNGWQLEHIVPSKQIVDLIHEELPLEPADPNYFGEVAKRYRYKGTDREIGLISSVTQAFCAGCTRARVTADGKLYTCLFGTEGKDLRPPLRKGLSHDELQQMIEGVWTKRKDRYSEERLQRKPHQTKRKKVEMYHIGG